MKNRPCLDWCQGGCLALLFALFNERLAIESSYVGGYPEVNTSIRNQARDEVIPGSDYQMKVMDCGQQHLAVTIFGAVR